MALRCCGTVHIKKALQCNAERVFYLESDNSPDPASYIMCNYDVRVDTRYVFERCARIYSILRWTSVTRTAFRNVNSALEWTLHRTNRVRRGRNPKRAGAINSCSHPCPIICCLKTRSLVVGCILLATLHFPVYSDSGLCLLHQLRFAAQAL